MEVIKRKIDLEPYIDRRYNSETWGTLTATSFYVKIKLTQTLDDSALFTDSLFLPTGSTMPSYTPLKEKLASSGYTFPFMNGVKPVMNPIVTEYDLMTLRLPSKKIQDYYYYGNLKITGSTDSKIEDVRSYDLAVPFKVDFNINTDTYRNYKNVSVDGVDRVKNMGEPSIYVFDTPDDGNLGTANQVYGLRYLDYTGITNNVVIDGESVSIPLTVVNYVGEGWNQTNTSLFASIKEEYLFGITAVKPTDSDLYLDRGATNVLDMHLRMSEVKNLSQLQNYGNGYYKLNKQ